jgi:chromosome segregation ATPase
MFSCILCTIISFILKNLKVTNLENLMANNSNAFANKASHCVELEKRIKEVDEAMTKLKADKLRVEQEKKDHDVRANILLKEQLSSLELEYEKLEKEIQALRQKVTSFLDILAENEQVNKFDKSFYG